MDNIGYLVEKVNQLKEKIIRSGFDLDNQLLTSEIVEEILNNDKFTINFSSTQSALSTTV